MSEFTDTDALSLLKLIGRYCEEYGKDLPDRADTTLVCVVDDLVGSMLPTGLDTALLLREQIRTSLVGPHCVSCGSATAWTVRRCANCA